jgi:hypothetical protein
MRSKLAETTRKDRKLSEMKGRLMGVVVVGIGRS